MSGETIEKLCGSCQEIFHPRVADAERVWGKFCSKSCAKRKSKKNYIKRRNRRRSKAISSVDHFDQLEKFLSEPETRYVSYEEIMSQKSIYGI